MPATTPLPLKFALCRQRGASYWSWLLIIGALGLAFTAITKMAPAYVDAYYVEKGLQQLAEQDDIQTMSRAQVRAKLQRFFTINNVRGQPTKAVKVTRHDKSMLITVDYEVRQSLFYNVDVVMHFNKQLNTARADQCCKPLIHLQ